MAVERGRVCQVGGFSGVFAETWMGFENIWKKATGQCGLLPYLLCGEMRIGGVVLER